MSQTRILIVEDEAIVARDIAQQLTLLGYEPVGQTPRGEQALVLADQLRPDLVLMDIQLAGEMDGIAVAQAIRERFAIPVVFLTAFVDDATLERAKLTEPFGYIIKPFQGRELRTVIEMALYKHQAEIQLRNSQEELAAILRTALDGFCFLDAEGRFLVVNEAYCQLIGYSRDELLRMAIRDVEADETPAEIVATLDRIRKLGAGRFERRHRSKDGRLVHLEVSANYLPGSDGRLVCFYRDITQRKQAEAALRTSEDRYRSLFENMRNGFAYCQMLFDQGRPQDFIYLEVNDAFETLTGLKDVVGKRVSELIPGIRESDPQLFEVYGRVALTGVPEQFETYANALGIWFAISVYSPSKEHFVAIFEVITARKQAEMALRENEERFRLALEATGGGTYSYDFASDEGHYSPELKRLFGFGPDAPLLLDADKVPMFIHPDDRSAFLTAMTAALDPRGDGFLRVEYRGFHADGSIRWLQVNGRTEFSGEGSGRRPSRTAGVVIDITERKQTQEELRQAKDYTDNIIHSMADMLVVLSPDGTIATVNKATCDLLRYSEHELLGQPATLLFEEEEEEEEEDTIYSSLAQYPLPVKRTVLRRLVKVGSVSNVERSLRTKSGVCIPVLLSGSIMRDDGGEIRGIVCIASDITDRKGAERRLRIEKARAQEYLNIAGVILLALDGNSNITLLNRKGYEVLEYPEGSLIGRNWLETCLPARERDRLLPVFRQLIAGDIQAVEYVENMVLTRSGNERLVAWHNTAIFDQAGTLVCTLSSGEDVTDRKQAELRIRHLNEVLRAVRDIGELIVREQNMDRLLAKACNTLVHTRGYRLVWIGGIVSDSKRVMPLASAGPAVDYLDDVIITWDESDTGRGPMGTALRERKTIVCQDTAIDSSSMRWREAALARGYRSITAVPMIHTGRLFGAIAVYADHPAAFDNEELRLLDELASDLAFALHAIEIEQERQHAELGLVQAKITAEAANRAKSEFLANMSHEIRTPMTAILGFSDLLASPNVPYQERREFLAGIQRNGKALLELIGDILDLSRIEADRLTLEKADYPLQQIINDVLSVVQVRAEQKGLVLEVDYAFPLPATIHTDPVRLRQVLTNLIGNAVKFTERGAVRVAVRCMRETDGLGRMQFAISDTGIGIPADKIDELFDPFTQVDASASRRYGGTGLGLAISRRLAKALGGDVEVTSQLGTGSTFTLTIDAGSAENSRLLQSPRGSPTAQKEPPPMEHETTLHGRVLLVEDVPDVCVALRHILRWMNLESDVAENGVLACEMAEKSRADGRPYDLILMDIQMPKMNGYEATRWLRQHGWQGLIVALTAHALVGDREKCLEAGCNDCITKPITGSGLRDALAHYLGQAAAAAPSTSDR